MSRVGTRNRKILERRVELSRKLELNVFKTKAGERSTYCKYGSAYYSCGL